MQEIDDKWKSWIAENVARGCTRVSMIDQMVAGGIDKTDATKAVEAAQPVKKVTVGQTLPQKKVIEVKQRLPGDRESYMYEPSKIGLDATIDADGQYVEVLMRVAKPELVVFGNVLTWDECQEIIRRAGPKMARSTIVDAQDGSRQVIPNRTSDGAFFKRGEDDFILGIEKRLAILMNEPLEHGEGLQILNYKVGGEYREHFDYFPPSSPGSKLHTERYGQRRSTMIVYLNDVKQGGATSFPSAGVHVAAKQGNGVFFRYQNLRGQLDPMSLHAGTPVAQGEKWIITKWVREKPYI